MGGGLSALGRLQDYEEVRQVNEIEVLTRIADILNVIGWVLLLNLIATILK